MVEPYEIKWTNKQKQRVGLAHEPDVTHPSTVLLEALLTPSKNLRGPSHDK
jgi:hypothetical protein